jgi:hypothetical protein
MLTPGSHHFNLPVSILTKSGVKYTSYFSDLLLSGWLFIRIIDTKKSGSQRN